jgi:hypothetical protein
MFLSVKKFTRILPEKEALGKGNSMDSFFVLFVLEWWDIQNYTWERFRGCLEEKNKAGKL